MGTVLGFAPGRRNFLKGSLAGAAALLSSSGRATRGISSQPVVTTRTGKLQGSRSGLTFVFKGIPYGAPTAGNRFLPPRPAGAWSGTREALQYGALAVQGTRFDREYNRMLGGLFPPEVNDTSHSTIGSEECLFLNVWTSELGCDAKLPVMVWLHPGALSAWSGNALWTEGSNLAAKHGVVVVSLNHRLNIFGHLYLGELGGAKYAESGNVGLMDIVAALQWIQDNIGEFGGDAGNVTLFGQSGGASKVSLLLAMPPASGLFHKAIAMSGSAVRCRKPEMATRNTLEILRRLGINRHRLNELAQVPAPKLYAALAGSAVGAVAAGASLPCQPFVPDAPIFTAKVPMMIGTTHDELTYPPSDRPLPTVDFGGVRHSILATFPGVEESVATRAIDGYRTLHPGKSWHETYIGVATGVFRDDVMIQAETKAKQGQAPVFMYQFTWTSPAFPEYGSSHCFDVPFAFDNVDAAPQLYGADPDPRRYMLAEKMSKAWANFARSSNPNHPGLPHWDSYTVKRRATMIINYDCGLVNDPQSEDRKLFESIRSERLEAWWK